MTAMPGHVAGVLRLAIGLPRRVHVAAAQVAQAHDVSSCELAGQIIVRALEVEASAPRVLPRETARDRAQPPEPKVTPGPAQAPSFRAGLAGLV
jgi:hypothetical protein